MTANEITIHKRYIHGLHTSAQTFVFTKLIISCQNSSEHNSKVSFSQILHLTIILLNSYPFLIPIHSSHQPRLSRSPSLALPFITWPDSLNTRPVLFSLPILAFMRKVRSVSPWAKNSQELWALQSRYSSEWRWHPSSPSATTNLACWSLWGREVCTFGVSVLQYIDHFFSTLLREESTEASVKNESATVAVDGGFRL
jgi:hypothetical protein